MPVGPYKDFAACERAMHKKYGKDGAKRVCGKMEAQSRKHEVGKAMEAAKKEKHS